MFCIQLCVLENENALQFRSSFSLDFCRCLPERSIFHPINIFVLMQCWVLYCALEGSTGEPWRLWRLLILQEQKALLSSVCSFPWCKYSHHTPSQATDATLLNAKWERAEQQGPHTGEVSDHGATDTKGRGAIINKVSLLYVYCLLFL